MENQILDILKEIQKEQQETNKRLTNLESVQQDTNQRLTNMEDRLINLEEGQKRIEKKIDITYDQVARTAEDVTFIKKDVNRVEYATACNWADIARLKAIR